MAAKRGRSQKNNNARKQPTSMTIPAAIQTRYQPHQETTTTRVKGCDNLEIIATSNSTSYPLGQEVLSGSLTATSSARLASLSKAFQRIKWHMISFTIEGAYPTQCGGGYVVCFVRDPDDVPPQDPQDAVKWAMAQQHSADAKWYDSVRLNVRATPDLLFTSEGTEPRMYSPGTLFIISKTGPAQVGALTVNFQWDVSLSEPTSEVKSKVNSDVYISNGDYYLPFNKPTDDFLKLQVMTAPSLDPHGMTFRDATTQDLGLQNLVSGNYLRFKEPVIITGEYNTGNDYIPIHVSGFVVDQNGHLLAVAELGNSFVVIASGSPPAAPSGFINTNWHLLSGGYGTTIETGEDLHVYLKPQDVHDLAKKAFGLPRQPFRYNGTNLKVDGNQDPNVGQINLTGER